jgi:hypothetical protein
MPEACHDNYAAWEHHFGRNGRWRSALAAKSNDSTPRVWGSVCTSQ